MRLYLEAVFPKERTQSMGWSTENRNMLEVTRKLQINTRYKKNQMKNLELK